jgi:hypothetical protein
MPLPFVLVREELELSWSDTEGKTELFGERPVDLHFIRHKSHVQWPDTELYLKIQLAQSRKHTIRIIDANQLALI